MSYARFAKDSSVYVFANTDGMIECCGCSLRDDVGVRAEFPSVAEMELHLCAHEAVGGKVPATCYQWMREDRAQGELR